MNNENDYDNEHIVTSNVSTRQTWLQLKQIVELNRKLMFNLNSDVPTSITFRENPENLTVNRIYFLANNSRTRENTLKYIDIEPNKVYEQMTGQQLILNDYNAGMSTEKVQLTKEEQLLRERQRCAFSGITSYSLDSNSQRILFSDHSELFYYDDNKSSDVQNKIAYDIKTSSKGAINFQICPNNSNLISYVLNDNLFIQNLLTKREYQLTHTEDPVKSGVPSYAVQEEFSRYVGYWWQPVCKRSEDGTSETYRIVYEEIDDQFVDTTYITPSVENEYGYDSYRYPKPGTANSKIYLKMVEIKLSKDFKTEPVIVMKRMHKSFYDLFSWYEYLVRAEWTPCGRFFYAQIFDRLQTRAVRLLLPLDYFVDESDSITRIETNSKQTTTKHVVFIDEQTSETWINYNNIMYFLHDSEDYLSFIAASEETKFLHLFMYRISLKHNLTQILTDVLLSDEFSKTQLTEGDWCVEYDENVYVDQENHLVYFTAYQNPLESQFFVADYLNPGKVRQLTENGFSHQVFVDKKCTLFVSICSNLSVSQKIYTFAISNQQSDNIDNLSVKLIGQIINRNETESSIIDSTNSKYLPLLIVNSQLNLNLDALLLAGPIKESHLISMLFRPPELFSFEIESNCKLYGMLYMPINYEPGVKYPTVLYMYGGPKAQLVTNAYKANKFSRFNVLSMLGYCVLVVDSRGSDYRGMEFESHLHRRMGTVEIADQVKGIEYAVNKFNCIDSKRIAIFGWSYGGYMALMGLAQRPDIFKVAISGAPVTTWNLYDTAYTERYMGLPDENKEGYEKGSVLNYAKGFPNEENRLLIIHGMIDENVHFVHTRKLIDALIKENKPYTLQVYPKERHGIRSSEASIHCDVNFYSFLENNLKFN